MIVEFVFRGFSKDNANITIRNRFDSWKDPIPQQGDTVRDTTSYSLTGKVDRIEYDITNYPKMIYYITIIPIENAI